MPVRRAPAAPARAGRRRCGPVARIARNIASASAARPSRSSSSAFIRIGRHVIGIDRQRAIEAGQAALEVAGQVERLEQVEPDRRRPGLGGRGPLEPVAIAAAASPPLSAIIASVLSAATCARLRLDQRPRARPAAASCRPSLPRLGGAREQVRPRRRPPSALAFRLERGRGRDIGLLPLDAPISEVGERDRLAGDRAAAHGRHGMSTRKVPGR